LILSSVHKRWVARRKTLRSAADTAPEALKNEGMKDFDKEVEVLGPISSESFSQLISLGNITDYGRG
jgi:hypothetical protein